jgi:hypothetical protein
MSSNDDATGEQGALKKQDKHQLREQDICCGTRGRAYWHHPGNKTFSHLIQASAHLYSKSKDEENKRLFTSIVEEIQNLGHRFVKEDKTNAGRWIELDKAVAREKTRHAIRAYWLGKTKKQTITKKKEALMKKRAVMMDVTRSREIHQISPSYPARTAPSALMQFHQGAPIQISPSYPARTAPSALMQFHQRAPMPAPVHQISPSYPARTAPSALMQFHQRAPMPAPALNEPGYPLFTDTNGSSTYTKKKEEFMKKTAMKMGVTRSREISPKPSTTVVDPSYQARTALNALLQFYQRAPMPAPAMNMDVTRSREINQISPKPSAAVDGSYQVRTAPSALMQFHQGAPMPAPAMNMDVTRSREINQISPSYPARTAPSALMQFHQGAPMPAPVLNEPGYPLFTDINGSSTFTKKKEEFIKKTAMQMGVTRSREIHQIAPKPSAAVDASYPARTVPSEMTEAKEMLLAAARERKSRKQRERRRDRKQFHQRAPMPAPVLNEPGYPLFTDINGSSTFTKKKEDFKKESAMKMDVTRSIEINQPSATVVDASYPKAPRALSHFYQEARMRVPALDEPGCPLFVIDDDTLAILCS